MTTFLLIISIYIALNLAMLAFRPVRSKWKMVLDLYKELLVLIWTDFPEGFKEPKRWWLKCLYIPSMIITYIIGVLVLIIITIFPIFIYTGAIRLYKEEPYRKSHPKPPVIPPMEEWGDGVSKIRIPIYTDLPYPITPMLDVIYVEDENNFSVNQYIQTSYKELCYLFSKNGLTFNYSPMLSERTVSSEVLSYMFPNLPSGYSYISKKIDMSVILHYVYRSEIHGPGLIFLFEHKEEETIQNSLIYCPLLPNSKVSIADQFKWYAKDISSTYHREMSRRVVRYCIADLKDSADTYFSESSPTNEDLIEEIRMRISELQKRGIQLHLIHELIEERPTLSRLFIDKDYRIFLPDYNNMEITMSPLPKAVFLFFLKHPEGIVFKNLPDYNDELLMIYKQISNRISDYKLRKSIKDLTDPTLNSINEKCTRIREAFVSKFDNLYAQYYYITGKRGEPKKIALPRELVDLQGL